MFSFKLRRVFLLVLLSLVHVVNIGCIKTNGNAVAINSTNTTTPTLSINSVSTTEGNSGTKTLTFTVTQSAVSASTTTFNWATSDVTATAGSDYAAVSSTLATIAAGASTATFAVIINGDTTVESDETFTVTINSPNNATILTAAGIGTITNDDSAVIIQLSLGFSSSCVLMSFGGVKCWGGNSDGQLGIGDNVNTNTPQGVVGLSSGVTGIFAGVYHTCAIVSSGGLKCWGRNSDGQLGTGDNVSTNTPQDVVGLSSGITAVTGGNLHTCALTSTGGVKCWGRNFQSQLGTGNNTAANTPQDVVGLSSGITRIFAGDWHTCALTNTGGVKCWGWNVYGGLGTGNQTEMNTPQDVVGLSSGVTAITAGAHHTCALTSAGGVKCWGWNDSGQLGIGNNSDITTPGDVQGLSSGVIAISAGGANSHTCALTSSGGVKCWGYGQNGQLGAGNYSSANIPQDVVGLSSGAIEISAGDWHTCALTSAGEVKCWGENIHGQLGTGNNVISNSPQSVVLL
jgi:alpha-tubulin suppressor-like RCC1 family protein